MVSFERLCGDKHQVLGQIGQLRIPSELTHVGTRRPGKRPGQTASRRVRSLRQAKGSFLHINDLAIGPGPASTSKAWSSPWPAARYTVMTGVLPAQPEGLMKEASPILENRRTRTADMVVSLLGGIVGMDVAASHWPIEIARTDRSARVPDHAAPCIQSLVAESSRFSLECGDTHNRWTTRQSPLRDRVRPAAASGRMHPPFLGFTQPS